MWPTIAILIGTTLAGGLLPFVAGRSHRLLHRFVAVATGLFLGTVFLHLLPEALEPVRDGLGEPWPGALVLAGVVTLYVIENVALPGKESSDRHIVVGWGSFVGLTLHALAAGAGLAAVSGEDALAAAVLVALAAHKAAEGFSLATVFRLSGAGRARIGLLLVAFSLATPAGYAVARVALDDIAVAGQQAFTAVAAGTFLFVSLCDLLPEVFHGRDDARPRLLLLALGIGVSAVLHSLG